MEMLVMVVAVVVGIAISRALPGWDDEADEKEAERRQEVEDLKARLKRYED